MGNKQFDIFVLYSSLQPFSGRKPKDSTSAGMALAKHCKERSQGCPQRTAACRFCVCLRNKDVSGLRLALHTRAKLVNEHQCGRQIMLGLVVPPQVELKNYT